MILFAKNGGGPDEWRALTRSLQRAARASALVAVDQEGGEIRNLPFAGPEPAQPLQGSPAQVRSLARDAGGELRDLGINVDLAPVADVSAGAAALAGRTFPGDAGEVAERTRASVAGFRASGVAATAKHFPGLGAAAAQHRRRPGHDRRRARRCSRTASWSRSRRRSTRTCRS